MVDVGTHQAIGGQQNVVVEFLKTSILSVIQKDVKSRCKSVELCLPVGEKSRWCNDDDMLLVEHAIVLDFLHQCDDLKRLSKSHVIGKNAAKP